MNMSALETMLSKWTFTKTYLLRFCSLVLILARIHTHSFVRSIHCTFHVVNRVVFFCDVIAIRFFLFLLRFGFGFVLVAFISSLIFGGSSFLLCVMQRITMCKVHPTTYMYVRSKEVRCNRFPLFKCNISTSIVNVQNTKRVTIIICANEWIETRPHFEWFPHKFLGFYSIYNFMRFLQKKHERNNHLFLIVEKAVSHLIVW